MEAMTLRAGVRIALAAALAQAVLHTFNMLVLDGRAWHLNADTDGNSLSWLGSMTIFAAALGALLLATVTPRRTSLLVLAAVLAVLSLDELIAIHERLGQEGREALDLAPELGRIVWPVLFLPLLGAVLLTGWKALGLLAPPARRQFLAGLGLLVLAVALEVVWTPFFFVGGEVGDWPDVLQVGAEEGAELAGWILVASALLAEYVRRAREVPAR
jgi:hypothetical protein